jgi:hypothetical protein
MTTAQEAWSAGIDAAVRDNTINKAGFADAIRQVLTQRFSDAQAKAWIDAVATEYHRLGLINNPTYSSLRGAITKAGADSSLALFEALGLSISVMAETIPATQSAQLVDLREDRDQIDAALARCDELIAAEPTGTVGRLIKDVLRQGKVNLRQHRMQVRSEIQVITGDPDA